jgi:hypothetical protein
MPDVDLDPGSPKKPDMLTIISTLIAAALVLPAVWWLQSNQVFEAWLRAIFTG